MMGCNKNIVQNGTYKQLGKDVGIIAAVNSDSKINVSVYMSDREKYVSEFNLWSKKTAQASLETGRVVYEAKQNLTKDEFKAFVGDIKAGPTIRKYLAIGKHYDKFYQYAELLPNAWTSIYEITLLPADVFDALVATESSMANMTGAQLKLLKGKGSDSKSKSSAAASAVTPADATVPAAPATAQDSSEASEDADDTQSLSGMSDVATASSDAIQNDSSESVADAADEAVSDEFTGASDAMSSKQKFKEMFERMSRTPSIDVKAFPYEILIRFKSAPSDNTWWDLVEGIDDLVEQHKFDVEIIEARPEQIAD